MGKALCLLALISAGAQAQRAGTIELGAFGHYTKLDEDVLLGDKSMGVGGRLGFFAMRYIGLEVEYGVGSISSDNPRGVNKWYPFRGIVTLNATIASRARLLVGAGYKHDNWEGDSTANQYEDGFTALAGLRLCFGDKWSFRPEVVYDKNPSPNFQTPTTSTSSHFGFRAGISRFFGRGSGTCGPSDAAAMPAAPPPVAQPPVTPPTPPAPPAPTVTLTAIPTSIIAGNNATLTWTSLNATSCSATWTTSTGTSGSITVSPTATTTYTITCTGSGGSTSSSATVGVAMPTPPTPPAQPPAQQPPREVFRLEGVFFDFDKSDIKPEGRVKLDSAVTILNRFADMRVEIQGHTDSIGTEEYNIGLSHRRANAVRDYLISKGIAATRLTTRGFGETAPAADNATREGRALNRRVIIIELR
jgi:outer membrane protein OmpA-like peptidoglycan-associated protein